MLKFPGKSLSFILSLLIILIHGVTIVGIYVNNFILSYIWNISFLAIWVIMLIFCIKILFSKDSDGMSIVTAILTSLALLILSVYALVVVARFIRNLPQNISFSRDILNKNSQLIFYTTLIITYFIHMINYIRLRGKEAKFYEKKDKLVYRNEDKLDKNQGLRNPSQEDLEILNSHQSKDDDLLL